MKLEMRRLLERDLTPVMTRAGFRRSGNSWYAEYPETIAQVNLQKSAWGNAFYLNLGIYLRALGLHNPVLIASAGR